MASSCHVLFTWISVISLSTSLFRVIFSLGKRKKAQGAKSGKEDAKPQLGQQRWHSQPLGKVHCWGEESRFWKQFAIQFLKNILKALQNCFVNSMIHAMAPGNKFTMHQTLNIKDSSQYCFDFWLKVSPFLNREYHSNVKWVISLKTRTQMVLEMFISSPFYHLTQLLVREYFTVLVAMLTLN